MFKNLAVKNFEKKKQTWYVPFIIWTGIACGSEWWYGFFIKIDKTSILDGLVSLPSFIIVLCSALSQYVAYFPHSVFESAFLAKCNFKYQRIRLFFGTNNETANESNCHPCTKV